MSYSEQIIVYKPKGAVIEPHVLAKLKKEYTATESFYFYRSGEDGKFYYSDKAKPTSNHDKLLDAESDSIIYFHKSHYVANFSNPIHNFQQNDHWVLTAGVGKFPFLLGVDQKGPDTMHDSFIKFLDLTSLHSFVSNLCNKFPIHYAVVVQGSDAVKRYGNWEEIDGVFYTNTNFFYKLEFEAKSLIKTIVAFFTNPLSVKEEIKKMDSFSDLKLREEAVKVPNLLDAVNKL